jgi:hypothetical protein
MAKLDSTIVYGNLKVTKEVSAEKIVKEGGTSSQFLKADGSVDTTSYNPTIGTNSDINTGGATIVDNIYVTNGVVTSHGSRVLAATDIGAMRVQSRVVNDANHSDFRIPGSYGFNNNPTNGTGEAYGAMLVAANSDTGLQIAGGYSNDDLYFRGWASSGSTYYAWRRLLHEGNYNSYAPTKTGGGASGTWSISISGSAGTLDGIDSGSFLRSDATDYMNNTIYQRGYFVNETGYRDRGVYGNYDSNKTNHIWSMGAAYKNAADGSNFGNLYGLSYYHPNNATNGQMAGSHQMVWASNGTPQSAMGQNLWTSGNVQASGGNSNEWNTAYDWGNHASAGYSNTDTNTWRGIDDSPVNGQTAESISSNWAFDHEASSTAHPRDTRNQVAGSYNNYSLPSTVPANIFAVNAGNANRLSFWGSGDTYSISMGNNQANHGSVTDYSMHHNMGTTGGRGFTFGSSRTAVSASINALTGAAHFNGTLSSGGDVVAFSSSDRRFKDNIKPIEKALDKVMSISGNTFDWNTELQDVHKGADIGVVAQEIKAILPEIVTTRDDGFLAVKYDKLVALLIESTKEQQAQINDLRNELNLLKNK